MIVWPPVAAVLFGTAFKFGFAKLLFAHWMAASAIVVLPLLVLFGMQRYHRARLAYSQRRMEQCREEKAKVLKRVKVELPMKQALELLSRHDPGGDHKELIQLPPEHAAEVAGLKADKANLAKIVDSVLARLLVSEDVAAAVLQSLGEADDGDDARDGADAPAAGAAGGAGAAASVPATPAAAGRAGAPGTAYKTPAAKSTARAAAAGAGTGAAATQGKTPHTASRNGAPSTARRRAGDTSAAKALLSHLLPPESVDLLLEKHGKDLPACTPMLTRVRRGGAAGDDDAAGAAGAPSTLSRMGALGDWVVGHIVAEEGEEAGDGHGSAAAASAAAAAPAATATAAKAARAGLGVSFASPAPARASEAAASAVAASPVPSAAAVAAAIDEAASEAEAGEKETVGVGNASSAAAAAPSGDAASDDAAAVAATSSAGEAAPNAPGTLLRRRKPAPKAEYSSPDPAAAE